MISFILTLATPILIVMIVRRGSTPPIDARIHPNSLTALEPVTINGSQQWILIRTENTANPLVLFVHGGPGTSQLGMMRRNTRALERCFTVVNWDQRGAGKSFAAGLDRSRMTLQQVVADVIALASYLTDSFHQKQIVLVGHSWGSAVGALAAAQRPDLFSAYVGVGQMSRAAESELLSYQWTIEQARRRDNKAAVAKLQEIGPPPYTGAGWRSKFITQRSWLARLGGEYHASSVGAVGVVLANVLSREYTFSDRLNFFRGIALSLDTLMPQLGSTDLFRQVPEFGMPVYFCLGRHDREVPCALAAAYFEALKAPHKELIWFENSAHLPNTEEREKFNQFMMETVLPRLSAPHAALHAGLAPALEPAKALEPAPEKRATP
jgi:pimeloyl-ACP methyl ester carboxylesterase